MYIARSWVPENSTECLPLLNVPLHPDLCVYRCACMCHGGLMQMQVRQLPWPPPATAEFNLIKAHYPSLPTFSIPSKVHALGNPQDQGSHVAGDRRSCRTRIRIRGWMQQRRPDRSLAQSRPPTGLGGRSSPVLRRTQGRVGHREHRRGQQVPQLRDLRRLPKDGLRREEFQLKADIQKHASSQIN